MNCAYCGKKDATYNLGHIAFCNVQCFAIYMEEKKNNIIYNALVGKKK